MLGNYLRIDINASKINLSNKDLSVFPTELFKCKNLKKLNLSNNRISSVPKDIYKLSRLENLDLSENRIPTLYSKIFELKNLKTLIINKNLLKKIPKQIGNLKCLKTLSFAGNEITEFPEEIADLVNLEKLNIANNPILNFPLQILLLPNLKTLWINNNTYDLFPANEMIINLKKLKALYCYSASRNSLDKLDKQYLSLTRIKGNSVSYLKALSNNPPHTLKNEALDKNHFYGNNKPINKLDTRTNNMANTKEVKKSKIFISYSHKDKEWLEILNPYIKGMQLEGLKLDYWDDTKIKTGENWKEEIAKALKESNIAILLISQDFLASDFIQNNELPIILENAKENGIRVLPVILSPCRFLKTNILKDFQSLNKPEIPLNSLEKHQIQSLLVRLTYDIEESIGI